MSNTMTNEEAIRILDPDCKEKWKAYDGKDFERCDEACRMGVKAIGYRIPKKPEQGTTNAFIYACPTCGGPVGSLEVEEIWCDFCPKCGQAIDKSLDWSDEE